MRHSPLGLICRILLLAALTFLPNSATAQILQGSVADSVTGHPVIGGMVLLLGGHDSVFASATTTERGTFALPAVAAGTYRLRVLRIGARAWTSPPLTLEAGQRRNNSWLVASEPVVLSAITARSTSGCRGDPNADADVATLWEEARKGLRLADGTVQARILEYRTTVTTRIIDPDGRVVSSEPRGRVGHGTWPVGTLPAESLAAGGFVQTRDSIMGPRYYGPDARVFFSESFLGNHCFRAVLPADGDSTRIGVGFEPLKSRRLPDIQGVLWLDRRSAELRRLEYRYTGLGRWISTERVGGEVDFKRLANGSLIISGWRMIAPVPRVGPLEPGEIAEPEVVRLFGPHKVKLVEFLEQEGRVEEARAEDGTMVWRAP